MQLDCCVNFNELTKNRATTAAKDIRMTLLREVGPTSWVMLDEDAAKDEVAQASLENSDAETIQHNELESRVTALEKTLASINQRS